MLRLTGVIWRWTQGRSQDTRRDADGKWKLYSEFEKEYGDDANVWWNRAKTPHGCGGVGTMVSTSGDRFFLCAPVLRKCHLTTTEKGEDGRLDSTVEEVVRERREWTFDAREPRENATNDKNEIVIVSVIGISEGRAVNKNENRNEIGNGIGIGIGIGNGIEIVKVSGGVSGSGIDGIGANARDEKAKTQELNASFRSAGHDGLPIHIRNMRMVAEGRDAERRRDDERKRRVNAPQQAGAADAAPPPRVDVGQSERKRRGDAQQAGAAADAEPRADAGRKEEEFEEYEEEEVEEVVEEEPEEQAPQPAAEEVVAPASGEEELDALLRHPDVRLGQFKEKLLAEGCDDVATLRLMGEAALSA
eukprot:gene19535-40105_t